MGRNSELQPVEQICNLYGNPELHSFESVRLQMLNKTKKGLKLLPPSHDALELHI